MKLSVKKAGVGETRLAYIVRAYRGKNKTENIVKDWSTPNLSLALREP